MRFLSSKISLYFTIASFIFILSRILQSCGEESQKILEEELKNFSLNEKWNVDKRR